MGKLNQTIRVVLAGSLWGGICTVSHAKPAPAISPSPPTPPAGESTVEASRYVGEDVGKFVESVLPTLSIGTRTTDPFGQLQDPEAKPIVQTPINPAGLETAEPAVPFSDIIALIEINTVMSGEKRFLVGSRTFSQGDEFPLNFRGKQIRIQIIEVSSRQIQFKNLETGELAAHRLNLLPPGMRPGQGRMTAPGMVPSGRDAPLEIEPSNQSPAGSPTR